MCVMPGSVRKISCNVRVSSRVALRVGKARRLDQSFVSSRHLGQGSLYSRKRLRVSTRCSLKQANGHPDVQLWSGD
jgi:hypothetical protein